MKDATAQVYPVLVPWVLPLAQISLTGSTYTILIIALERLNCVIRWSNAGHLSFSEFSPLFPKNTLCLGERKTEAAFLSTTTLATDFSDSKCPWKIPSQGVEERSRHFFSLFLASSEHKLLRFNFILIITHLLFSRYKHLIFIHWLFSIVFIDKPEAKSQSKAQSPKKPQKGNEEFGLWASH